MRPILIINMKTYGEGTGRRAEEIRGLCESVKGPAEIILAVQSADIHRLSKGRIKIFAQHVDPVCHGSNTGHILPEAVKEAGASGTILNHAERQVDVDVLGRTVERCREVGLSTVVCANDSEMVGRIAGLKPDYIAYEPPELIGGNVSVSTAKPSVIKESVKKARGIPLLIGAGVKTGDDIRTGLSLGASGVLLASGIVKAADKRKALEDLMRGFPQTL